MDDLGCMTLDFPDGSVGRLAPRTNMDLCYFQLDLPQDVFFLESVNARLEFVEEVPSTDFSEQDPRAGLLC
jgi:hypothetical protein